MDGRGPAQVPSLVCGPGTGWVAPGFLAGLPALQRAGTRAEAPGCPPGRRGAGRAPQAQRAAWGRARLSYSWCTKSFPAVPALLLGQDVKTRKSYLFIFKVFFFTVVERYIIKFNHCQVHSSGALRMSTALHNHDHCLLGGRYLFKSQGRKLN